MPDLIAVDLGGTSIRAARFERPEPPAARMIKRPTQAAEGPQAVIDRIAEAIRQVSPPGGERIRIGVGAPGPLDPRDGVILEAPNLPGWIDIPLRQHLQDRFACPVAVGNDANLAALGEWRFGAGRGADDLLYLTLSTGIGGGVICGGRLLEGARGLAAELGHMTVEPGGPRCGCGQLGHLEAVASGPALVRRANDLLEAGEPSKLAALGAGLSPESIGEAAHAGDALAVRVISEAGASIGRHLADLVHAFNPSVIVLGGGVSRIGAPLFESIQAALQAHVIHPRYLDGLRLVPAALGDEAGLIGAMVIANET